MKNPKDQINKAYSTDTHLFLTLNGPFVDAFDCIWVDIQSDSHLLECTSVASSRMLAQPDRKPLVTSLSRLPPAQPWVQPC